MTTLFRIVQAGVFSFWRNIWLSSATIAVLVLSLSVATGILLLSVVAQAVVTELESKVDVSVYFKPDIEEQKITEVRKSLTEFPAVLEVRYTSKDDALEKFKERHAGNQAIEQALGELGDNPLEASLAIRAQDAASYEAVASFIENRFSQIIDNVNYRENAPIIEKLFAVTNALRVAGLILGAALFAIAGLIAHNTIRLAIFSMREEISLMRLVGASNWFIRGPFVVEGMLGGLIAGGATFFIFFGLVYLGAAPIAKFLPGVDMLVYYKTHWYEIFAFTAGLGILASTLSSYVAIRRYLKV